MANVMEEKRQRQEVPYENDYSVGYRDGYALLRYRDGTVRVRKQSGVKNLLEVGIIRGVAPLIVVGWESQDRKNLVRQVEESTRFLNFGLAGANFDGATGKVEIGVHLSSLAQPGVIANLSRLIKGAQPNLTEDIIQTAFSSATPIPLIPSL